ncbi:outer membrane protein transport protein [Salinicola sp. MIT1003]|uniref:OmpP1/FadL family transporter n=1 Tax=Salinicola sp. MIT1003 TaxID=1882734 RepID=UPI0008DE035D|nr:outer membrane protein transport protein [Salinicola sp. MIT1003]OHZ01234.1 Long-chain fatty acid transport protein [Salinicola sp. MIT1003]
MMIRYHRLSLAVALASAAVSGQALAGAFQLQEQSVSGQGTSWAGRASNVQDATIVFGNPAGMSFLDRAQLTAGTHYIDASSDIHDESGNQPMVTGVDGNGTPIIGSVATGGGSDGDMIPQKAIPFGYYVQPINDRWSFGLGVYAPFGLITDYNDDFKGRYFGNYSDLEVITAQPTLSYRFNDKLAIGFGVTYNHIKGELESKSPNPLNPTAAGDGTVNVKGDDDAWGYNIGMIYRPVESTTLGLTYRSKVEYHLTGDVDASNVFGGVGAGGPAFLNADGDASLDITLPETIDFSVTHQLDDRWTLMAGATYIRWSRFDQLVVDNDLGLDINEQQDYRDTWQYAAGLAYQLNPAWSLRGGIAYDQSPVKDAHRSPRVPTADRTLVSIGAGWTPIPDLTIDAAYSYIWEDRADVDLQDENGNSYQAEYDNSLNLFGVQATYRF